MSNGLDTLFSLLLFAGLLVLVKHCLESFIFPAQESRPQQRESTGSQTGFPTAGEDEG